MAGRWREDKPETITTWEWLENARRREWPRVVSLQEGLSYLKQRLSKERKKYQEYQEDHKRDPYFCRDYHVKAQQERVAESERNFNNHMRALSDAKHQYRYYSNELQNAGVPYKELTKALLLREAFAEWRLIKVTAERDEARAERAALAEQLEALELDRTCRVCLERPAEIAAVPCGHRFVCTSEQCRAKVDRHPDSRCYVCRTPMTGTLRIF